MNEVVKHLDLLPGIPRDTDGPVFDAPWQAQAFAMTLSLYERGVFTWQEWANALSEQIRSAEQPQDSEPGELYYLQWLNALEALVSTKGVSSARELDRYQRAWHNAAHRTAHGAPIVLCDEDLTR
jgi:nitrile hydratase accessory protein